MIGPLNQCGSVSTVDVGKGFSLHDEPDSFDGIEIRRIGREVEGLEEMPIELLPFAPGRIVEDEKIPFSRGNDRCVGLVEKGLEDVRIAVACLDGEEPPVRGQTVPKMLTRICSPLWGTRNFDPLIAHPLRGFGSPSIPVSSPYHSSTSGSAAQRANLSRNLPRRASS
jgi:hypothetical protein